MEGSIISLTYLNQYHDTGRTNWFSVHVHDGFVVANEPNFVGGCVGVRHHIVGDAYLQNVS
jgi:hypothetical protein